MRSGVLAVIVGAILLIFVVPRGGTELRFGLLGWGVMSGVGVAGGSVMAAVHGRPGTAFIGALVGSMLARLAASALGAWAAAPIGFKAAWPYVVGLGAGYVPLQVFEAIWFHRLDRKRS